MSFYVITNVDCSLEEHLLEVATALELSKLTLFSDTDVVSTGCLAKLAAVSFCNYRMTVDASSNPVLVCGKLL